MFDTNILHNIGPQSELNKTCFYPTIIEHKLSTNRYRSTASLRKSTSQVPANPARDESRAINRRSGPVPAAAAGSISTGERRATFDRRDRSTARLTKIEIERFSGLGV